MKAGETSRGGALARPGRTGRAGGDAGKRRPVGQAGGVGESGEDSKWAPFASSLETVAPRERAASGPEGSWRAMKRDKGLC